MLHAASEAADRGRPLTGRTVFVCLSALFGIMIAANLLMVRVALSTFGGVETTSSYKAGLVFKREISAAEAQAGRAWKVDAHLARVPEGGAAVSVQARDAAGRPVAGLAAQARLAHPTDSRRDRQMALAEVAPGDYRGETEPAPGQWDLILDLLRDGERVFRSKTRVRLP